MSSSGASSDGDGSAPNYNYLSFFAKGSYGKKLEEKRSRDLSIANTLEEKKRWKWMTWIAVAFMCLTNLVATIGLISWKYRKTLETTGMEGNLYEFIHDKLKYNLGSECRPKYRKTKECSQVAAQLFLVSNSIRDSVVWTSYSKHHEESFNKSTPGAFQCAPSRLHVDKQIGVFRIEGSGEGFYQIHSHMTVHSIPSNAQFRHWIIRDHLNTKLNLTSDTQVWDCGAALAAQDPDKPCFSSSLVTTEFLNSGDIISIRLEVNGVSVSPTSKSVDLNLVNDGCSSYFGIIRLGVTETNTAD